MTPAYVGCRQGLQGKGWTKNRSGKGQPASLKRGPGKMQKGGKNEKGARGKSRETAPSIVFLASRKRGGGQPAARAEKTLARWNAVRKNFQHQQKAKNGPRGGNPIPLPVNLDRYGKPATVDPTKGGKEESPQNVGSRSHPVPSREKTNNRHINHSPEI